MKKKKQLAGMLPDLRIVLLSIIAMLVFHRYIVRIALCAILGMIGLKSLEVSNIMPYISIESITAATILLSYLYGWQFSVLFAIIFGTVGYVRISKMNLISITQIFFMAISGVAASIFHGMGKSFIFTYIAVFIFKAVISYPIMEVVNSNPPKNLMHSVGDSFFNVFITIHVMNLIYWLLTALNLS